MAKTETQISSVFNVQFTPLDIRRMNGLSAMDSENDPNADDYFSKPGEVRPHPLLFFPEPLNEYSPSLTILSAGGLNDHASLKI
jgi:hypothetical protein